MVRGARPLAFMTMLALNAGKPVSADDLIEAIWGDDSPAQARHALHVFASSWRSKLGAPVIESHRGGYRLHVAADRVDALRFRSLLRQVNGDRSPSTLSALEEALALWRGPALSGAAESRLLSSIAAGLEEQRLEAIERRIDIALDLGHHSDLIGELTELVATNPLREHLRAQLMTALYRCGRQAEALASYREARALLTDELGIEPNDELRQLEQAILKQAPELRAPVAPVRVRDEEATMAAAVALSESWAWFLRERDERAYAAIDAEYDVVVDGLTAAIRRKQRATALRIIGGLWMYWIVRGHIEDGNRWCVETLALPGHASAKDEYAGIVSAGEIARVHGDWSRAAELKEVALELCTDDRFRGALLADLAEISIQLGDLARAEQLAQDSVELRTRLEGLGFGRAHALLALAEVREAQGALDEAIALYDESIDLWTMDALDGEVAFVRGRMLGRALRRAGRVHDVYRTYRLALQEALRLNDVGTVAAATQGLSWIALGRGDHAGAVRLLASVSGQAWQAALETHERASFEADVQHLREVVTPAEFEAAWAVGLNSPPA
jgi:DNA-binding SARP family transcriptional activator